MATSRGKKRSLPRKLRVPNPSAAQPRRATGEFDFKPAAEIPPDAQGMTPPESASEIEAEPNENTSRYQHLWGDVQTEARAGTRRVHFHCDEHGRWTSTNDIDYAGASEGPTAFFYTSMDQEYWEPGQHSGAVDDGKLRFLQDKDGLTVWGGWIVRDMLNAGEASPFPDAGQHGPSENAIAALTATHTRYYRRNGRHHLSAAMARSRGADLQLEKNPNMSRKLGGFSLDGHSYGQPAANALAAVLACCNDNPDYGSIESADPAHRLWRDPRQGTIFEVPVAEGGGYGVQPDECGDINGMYHGEDGKLLTKLLKRPAGTRDGYSNGAEIIHRVLAGQDLSSSGLYHTKSSILHREFHESTAVPHVQLQGWARTAFWAAMQDDEIKNTLVGDNSAEPRDLGATWYRSISRDLCNAPDGSDQTIWGSREQWQRGADVFLSTVTRNRAGLLAYFTDDAFNDAIQQHGTPEQIERWAELVGPDAP